MARRRRGSLHPNQTGKTVGYVRVSTEEQAAGGVSLAAQEARIRAFCTATERVLDEVFVDAGVSAKTIERPAFKNLLRQVEAGGIKTVLVLKIDRATRSVRDLAHLIDVFEKHGCAFVSVSESIDTGSAAGRMITNLLGVFAQFEREQIAERTAFALAHKRRERKAYGHAPFGWERQGDILVPVQSEQRALSKIRLMDAAGGIQTEAGRQGMACSLRPEDAAFENVFRNVGSPLARSPVGGNADRSRPFQRFAPSNLFAASLGDPEVFVGWPQSRIENRRAGMLHTQNAKVNS